MSSNEPTETPAPADRGTVAGGQPPAPPASDPAGERDARRREREQRRGPGERPAVMIPARRERLPLEAPLMRFVASAGIVGIAVVVSAIMGSQDLASWLIGLVASVVSLVLAAVLWSSRRL